MIINVLKKQMKSLFSLCCGYKKDLKNWTNRFLNIRIPIEKKNLISTFNKNSADLDMKITITISKSSLLIYHSNVQFQLFFITNRFTNLCK